jgi:hypothetical protein
MSDMRRLPAFVMLLALGMLPGRVDAFELTGAWASQADLCKQVFTKRGQTGFLCRVFRPLWFRIHY